MRILVFGASSGIGAHLVEQGLVRGDEVTAFIDDGKRLEPSSRLTVVTGNLLDASVVLATVSGHDAVLCGELRAGAAATIVQVMCDSKVRRIVAVSPAGGPDLDEALSHQNFAGKLVMRTVASTVMRGKHEDALALERALEECNLDYTIVRTARLTDAPRSGSYRVDEEALPSGSLTIPRGDVAEFMLMQLDSPKYLRKRPYIAT